MYICKPKSAYCIVEPVPSSEFNKTGLAETPNEKDRISTGVVIAVGKSGKIEGYDTEFLPNCEVGETIVYKQYSEQSLNLNNKEYHIVRFDQIIANIEEN